MAITSSGSFVAAQSKTAGTTFSFLSTGSWNAGQLATLFVASDNLTAATASNNILSISDSAVGVTYGFSTDTGFNDIAYSIVTQSDGKIIVGGAFTRYGTSEAPGIVRLNTNGTIDSTFQDNLDVAGTVYKIIIQPDVTGSYRSGTGTWSAAASIITARGQAGAARFGGVNSNLYAGGGAAATTNATEEYNGSIWSAGGNMITARQGGRDAGIQNAALVYGGVLTGGSATKSALTEEYNGSTWAAGGALITAREAIGGAGTQNAALAFGGFTPATVGNTEEYNGTAWTAGGALITARYWAGGAGTQNAAVGFGGILGPSGVTCTEEYNGTSWSSGNAMINTRNDAFGGTGTQNASLATGGALPPVTCTEIYNGTSWSAGNALICGRAGGGAGGSQTAALYIGGYVPGVYLACTEQYLAPVTASISDKIIAVNDIGSGVVRLNDDGTTDASFGVSGSIINNGTVCAVIVQSVNEYLAGAWVAGGALICGRDNLAGAGTQNAALAIGGASITTPTTTFLSCTEKYDGNSWTAGNAIIIARSGLAGAGTQNTALAFGGYAPNPINYSGCTEAYNGSVWSTGGALITARVASAGAGTQNAALAAGGTPNGSIVISCTEEYNGSVWSAGGALIVARNGLGGVGTQNAALAFGGSTPTVVGNTEIYNGTSWSVGNNITTARQLLAGAGTQNAALAFGGQFASSNTEVYNGISWVTNKSMITGREVLAGAGTQISALSIGGFNGSVVLACTEAFTATSYTNKLIIGGTFTSYSGSTYSGSVRLNGDGSPDPTFNIGGGFTGSVDVRCFQLYNSPVFGAWSIGSALIFARNSLAGAGTQNEALAIGGNTGTTGCTEEYNGSIWSAGGNLINSVQALGGAGTQNAALAFGGNLNVSPFGRVTCTEEYDGTTWTAGGALIIARYNLAGAGSQNAALAIGGINVAVCNNTEIYNGTSWAAGGALITARHNLAGAGTQNDGLAFGGNTGAGVLSNTEEYNGTSWTTGGALTTANNALAGAGIQNAALGFGGAGNTGVVVSCTEAYNGTSWVAGVNNLITARQSLGGAGTQNAALAFGGLNPGNLSCTEAFNYSTSNFGLLAAGNFTGYSGSIRNRLALINLDNGNVVSTSSFNIGSTGFNANVNSIAVTSDYKVAAVGNFTTYSGSNTNRIVVINPDGTKDNTFNSGSGLTAEANTVKIVSIGSGIWSTGGAMITQRFQLTGTGTQNEALAIGGCQTPLLYSCTEEYNGSTWAAGGALITGRFALRAVGTQNEALAIAGFTNLSVACTEEYNGTAWAAGGALITARDGVSAAGTQNAALAAGGANPANLTCTEEYNGTSWSAGNAIITDRWGGIGVGTQNEALIFGGVSGSRVTCTEEYDGTNWSTGGALITARWALGGSGTQNEALAFGGNTNPNTTVSCTECYNGSSWSSNTAMITTREALGSAGSSYGAALGFGGILVPTNVIYTCTEAFNNAENFLVGGTFTAYSGSTSSGSARITPGGKIDTTFNIGAGFGAIVDVEEYLIESDVNNGIIAVGNFTTYSSSIFTGGVNRITKLNANGSIEGVSVATNTWTKVAERSDGSAAGAGATIALFYSVLDVGLPTGSSVTASLSGSITAKAASGWVFSGNNIFAFTGSTTASQVALTNALTINAPVNEYLFIRGIAYENPVVAFTPTANFTTMSAIGTSGGAVITNMSFAGQFRIVTTASLITNPTIGAATSNASIYWAFKESAAGKTYFILLD